MQLFSVKAVAKLTGLSSHRLRAWERRHAIVSPSRTPSGRRAYTLAEVEKLRLIAMLTKDGHSIASLAPMTEIELEALSARHGNSPESIPTQVISYYLNGLLVALQDFELDTIERWVLRALSGVPIRLFVLEIAAPLLREVGELVYDGRISIAQEHALSAILRNHLGELLTKVQRDPRRRKKRRSSLDELPLLVFATPEGDLHEFGILLAALLAGSQGFKFRYLGPNLPARDLAQAAGRLGAKVVILGSANACSKSAVSGLRNYVQSFLMESGGSKDHGITLWIGGHCDFDVASLSSSHRVVNVGSLADFDRSLIELI